MYRMVQLGTLIKPAKTERCGQNDYPVLSMTMYNGLVFQNDKFKKVIASKDTSEYKVVYRNQLVISFPIDEGVLAAQRITDVGIVSPAYGIWDIDQSQILPEFLEYALRCRRAIEYYKAKLRGSTARRRSLPTPTLLEFTVPLPNKAEQEKILEIINKTKAILEQQKSEIELLDGLIKSRFVELFDGKYETRTLGSVCEELFAGGDVKKEISSDIQTEEHPYPIYTNGEKNNGLYGYTSVARVTKEAITISGRGTIGFTCLRKEPFYPAVRLIVAVPNQELVSGCYLQHFVQSKNYGGQGASIPQLTVPMVKDELIPVPPMELQNAFAAFVEQTDKSKFKIQESLKEMQLLMDSLMQQYFG